MRNVILMIFISNILYCQNTLIEYDVLYNEDSYKTILYLTDSLSLWETKPEVFSSSYGIKFVFKSYNENKEYFKDGIFNKTFYVVDSLNKMKWELLNDTKEILSFKCHSAKTFFRGRSYTAYYTDKISQPDGPWKFYGLPGLILEVASDDNLYKFSATKITKNFNKNFELDKRGKFKFINWNEFTKKFKKTVDNYILFLKTNGDIPDGVDINIKITGPEIIYSKVQESEGINFRNN